MTSIYQRKDKRWVAQYTDARGKQKYLYAAKRKDVKAKLDKALEDQKLFIRLLVSARRLTCDFLGSPRSSLATLRRPTQ
jgi:hypothetical protein